MLITVHFDPKDPADRLEALHIVSTLDRAYGPDGIGNITATTQPIDSPIEPAVDLAEVERQIAENGRSDAAIVESELDSAGNPWVSELHIDSRGKYKENNPTAGQFKRRKGKSAADVQAYFLAQNGPPAPPPPEINDVPSPPPPEAAAAPGKGDVQARFAALTQAGVTIEAIKEALVLHGLELRTLYDTPEQFLTILAALEGLQPA